MNILSGSILQACKWAIPPKALTMLMAGVPNPFLPHKYACPGGWGTPRHASCGFQACCDLVRQGEKPDAICTEALITAARLLDCKMPYYWITKHLCDALLHTNPSPDLTVKDIPMPIPALTILLPEGLMQTPDGSALTCISIATVQKGYVNTHWQVPVRVDHRETDCDVMMVVIGLCSKHIIRGGWLPCTRKLAEMATAPFESYGADTHEDDAAFNNRMLMLAINIMFYVDFSRQQALADVEESTCVRKASQAKGVAELWAPSWIGKKYRVRREYNRLGGTHASPHAHWRSGHYRMVPYGPMSVPLALRPRRQHRIEAIFITSLQE